MDFRIWKVFRALKLISKGTQARVQGPGPPLEIEKQKKKKKKVTRANFKLFHLYFATFLSKNTRLVRAPFR